MKTYPYRLKILLWSANYCELTIVKINEEILFFNNLYPNGLTNDIVEFICEYGSCSFCGEKINKNLDRCKCNKPHANDAHLKISYSTNIDRSLMSSILKKEQMRRASYARKNRVKNNGGKFTRQETNELLKIQENLCYYCGKDFEIIDGKIIAHADHYISIHDGGKNEIQNIVMACVSCNSKKGRMNGNEFERIIRKSRPLELSRKLGVIRRKINFHFKQLGSPKQ